MTSVIHQKSSVKIILFGMVTDGMTLGLMIVGRIHTETNCKTEYSSVGGIFCFSLVHDKIC